jgi:hypothetical protein
MNEEELNLEIHELTEHLRRIRIEERETSVRLNQLLTAREDNRDKPDTSPKDRDGATIKKGDTVLFLTRGKYRSTQGVVESIKNQRLSARDKRGNLIVRAPHNTRVINEDGSREPTARETRRGSAGPGGRRPQRQGEQASEPTKGRRFWR